MIFGINLSKNYALDIALLLLVRSISDGMIWAKVEVNSDWYEGDHCPRFEIEIILLNITLFGVSVYNVNHVERASGIKELHVECPECKNPISIRME